MKKFERVRAGLRASRRLLWPKSIPKRIALVIGGVALIVVSLPFLFIGMFVGSQLLGALIGPINIFNSPSHLSSSAELLGTYKLEPKSVEHIEKLSSTHVEPSELKLSVDHTYTAINVYRYEESFDDHSQSLCRISGTGSWDVTEQHDVTLTLHLEQKSNIVGSAVCGKNTWLTYIVLGGGVTHRLWSNIGDPDSFEGLEYIRSGSP